MTRPFPPHLLLTAVARTPSEPPGTFNPTHVSDNSQEVESGAPSSATSPAPDDTTPAPAPAAEPSPSLSSPGFVPVPVLVPVPVPEPVLVPTPATIPSPAFAPTPAHPLASAPLVRPPTLAPPAFPVSRVVVSPPVVRASPQVSQRATALRVQQTIAATLANEIKNLEESLRGRCPYHYIIENRIVADHTADKCSLWYNRCYSCADKQGRNYRDHQCPMVALKFPSGYCWHCALPQTSVDGVMFHLGAVSRNACCYRPLKQSLLLAWQLGMLSQYPPTSEVTSLEEEWWGCRQQRHVWHSKGLQAPHRPHQMKNLFPQPIEESLILLFHSLFKLQIKKKKGKEEKMVSSFFHFFLFFFFFLPLLFSFFTFFLTSLSVRTTQKRVL